MTDTHAATDAGSSDRVSITLADGIADVRLTRADKMNALDPAMFAALIEAIERLKGMRGVRAVVLSGEGRAFCAGLDMASMAGGGSGLRLDERTHGHANTAQYVCTGWRELGVPVIAAIHGVAMGGGFQLLSGADIRVAHPATRMAIRETYWGLVPDMGGFVLWRGTAREDVLRELVYTSREFSAAEAQGWGLVTHVDDDPHARAMAIAREIADRSPKAVRAAKRIFNAVPDMDAAAILLAESEEQLALIRSPEQIEAVRANMEKRAAVFED
ncbi:crotonase/enoyl-CoA hydratase family protein [Sphingomonas sp.]|uniref:crotonase/enoyl-CoA hydratase family protein n=1 Tax=Sphingomonas sp. TaxID=28214 RepID=UPI0035C84940